MEHDGPIDWFDPKLSMELVRESMEYLMSLDDDGMKGFLAELGNICRAVRATPEFQEREAYRRFGLSEEAKYTFAGSQLVMAMDSVRQAFGYLPQDGLANDEELNLHVALHWLQAYGDKLLAKGAELRDQRQSWEGGWDASD